MSFEKEDSCLRMLGLGIPLVDIIATNVSPSFLEDYNLLPNDVIRAEEECHRGLWKHLMRRRIQEEDSLQSLDAPKVEIVAGGAVQNSMRVAQCILKKSNYLEKTTFLGAVGDDEFGREMRSKTETDGVTVCYQIEPPPTSTGTCLCLLTDGGKNRSLVADFGASVHFRLEFLEANFHLAEKAEIIYVSGFHFAVCPEAAFALAEHVHKWNLRLGKENKRMRRKYFVFNLSAVYVVEEGFQSISQKLLPTVDFLFGNAQEAVALAEMYAQQEAPNTDQVQSWRSAKGDPEMIAQLLADVPQLTQSNDGLNIRTVIITQGGEDILVAKTGHQNVCKIKVKNVEKIVDSNGAGDAFVGGFLAALAMARTEAECFETGISAAGQILQVFGCQLTLQEPE